MHVLRSQTFERQVLPPHLSVEPTSGHLRLVLMAVTPDLGRQWLCEA